MCHVMLPAGIHAPTDLNGDVIIPDVLREFILDDLLQLPGYSGAARNSQVTRIRAGARRNVLR